MYEEECKKGFSTASNRHLALWLIYYVAPQYSSAFNSVDTWGDGEYGGGGDLENWKKTGARVLIILTGEIGGETI